VKETLFSAVFLALGAALATPVLFFAVTVFTAAFDLIFIVPFDFLSSGNRSMEQFRQKKPRYSTL
jgi:hypothetical protein